MGSNLTFDFTDTIRFQASLNRLGKLPQKVVNSAAGKGATIAGKAVRKAAPRGKTKQLSKGFKREAERTRTKGKKVYRYGMNPDKNDVFQKAIPSKDVKNPGKRRTSWDHAYYPASIEYGFLTRSTGGGLDYVQGKYFTRDSAEAVRPQVNKTAIKAMSDALDKEWKKKK